MSVLQGDHVSKFLNDFPNSEIPKVTSSPMWNSNDALRVCVYTFKCSSVFSSFFFSLFSLIWSRNNCVLLLESGYPWKATRKKKISFFKSPRRKMLLRFFTFRAQKTERKTLFSLLRELWRFRDMLTRKIVKVNSRKIEFLIKQSPQKL